MRLHKKKKCISCVTGVTYELTLSENGRDHVLYIYTPRVRGINEKNPLDCLQIGIGTINRIYRYFMSIYRQF